MIRFRVPSSDELSGEPIKPSVQILFILKNGLLRGVKLFKIMNRSSHHEIVSSIVVVN